MRKVFKLYGSLVSDRIKLHGWLVLPCVEGEERILSAPKKIKVLSNLAKRKRRAEQTTAEMTIFVYTQSSKLGCFCRLLVKNGTQINSPIVASVVIITSLGKHVFLEEFIQGNNTIG